MYKTFTLFPTKICEFLYSNATCLLDGQSVLITFTKLKGMCCMPTFNVLVLICYDLLLNFCLSSVAHDVVVFQLRKLSLQSLSGLIDAEPEERLPTLTPDELDKVDETTGSVSTT